MGNTMNLVGERIGLAGLSGSHYWQYAAFGILAERSPRDIGGWKAYLPNQSYAEWQIAHIARRVVGVKK